MQLAYDCVSPFELHRPTMTRQKARCVPWRYSRWLKHWRHIAPIERFSSTHIDITSSTPSYAPKRTHGNAFS